MKKQTAVQWLQEAIGKKLSSEIGPYFLDLFEQAKEMEKENSEISFFAGYNYDGGHPIDEHEQFYKETFTETKND
jgi:hypothetical protein